MSRPTAGTILASFVFLLLAAFGGASYVRAHPRCLRIWNARMHGAEYLGASDVEYQKTAHDCGLRCLLMVAHAFGRSPDAAETGRMIGGLDRDVSFLTLMTAANRLGLMARAWVLSPDDLERAPKPLIAFVSGNHFVVVDAANEHFAIVRDPSLGRLRYPRRAFDKRWRGEALIFGHAETGFPANPESLGITPGLDGRRESIGMLAASRARVRPPGIPSSL